MKNRHPFLTILILGALIALSPFSIDMYLPAFPSIATALGTDVAHVGYSLTSYYAGLCIGQLIYGILIDRYGRKKPLMIGLLIFIAATIGCAISVNIDMLVGVRLLMALGGCVGMVAARAIVRDLFPLEEIAKVLSILVLIMGVAPIIAPTIGGWVTIALGWRWVFIAIGLIALVLLVLVKWRLPETHGGNPGVSLRIKTIIPGYAEVLKHRTFIVYAMAAGISYAGLYAYIAGAPFVFMQHFGFSARSFGLAFSFNACGLISGSQLNRLALRKHDSAKITLFAAVMLFFTALSMLLITATGNASALATLGFTFMFLFWVGMINPNATALALKPFATSAGKASALLGSIQMISGVMVSWLVSFFNNGSIVVMPAVMLGCAVLALGILFFRILTRQ